MFPMCLFNWRKIMQREKWKTMDVILVILAIFLLVFVIVMIAIYIRTGGIPDTLCTCVFSVCGGECGVMGWIKTTKDRHLSRQYELEDRETDKEERMEETETERYLPSGFKDFGDGGDAGIHEICASLGKKQG